MHVYMYRLVLQVGVLAVCIHPSDASYILADGYLDCPVAVYLVCL